MTLSTLLDLLITELNSSSALSDFHIQSAAQSVPYQPTTSPLLVVGVESVTLTPAGITDKSPVGEVLLTCDIWLGKGDRHPPQQLLLPLYDTLLSLGWRIQKIWSKPLQPCKNQWAFVLPVRVLLLLPLDQTT